MTSLLTFVSDIEDIRIISFNEDLSVETQNAFRDALLTHNLCLYFDIENVLRSKNTFENIKNRAFSLLIEEKDIKKVKKTLEYIIKKSEQNHSLFKRCEKYLALFQSS